MFKISKDLSLINFSNSILKKYGVDTFHPSIKQIDEIIKNKDKIVVFLCDGMGQYLLDVNKEQAKDFNKHRILTITSTFPPTTVAATTALLSGRYPIETGYMAWSQPFNNFSFNMDVFPKKDSQTGQFVEQEKYIERLKPYKSIIHYINEANADDVAAGVFEYPVDKQGPMTLEEVLEKVKTLAYRKTKTFTYAYMQNPDHDSHNFGVSSIQVKNDIKNKNDLISQFAKDNPDLTIFVIADHGQLDIEPLYLNEYDDIFNLLVYHPSFETRSPNFKIKDGKQEQFKKLFMKYFGKYFELYTKEEVINQQLFGYAQPLNNSSDFIGDFLAVSISNKALFVSKEENHFIGHHGGGRPEEMLIEIIGYNI